MGGRGSGGHNRSSLVTTNFEDGRNAAKSLGIGEPAVSLELGYERCKFSARTREPKQFVGSDCYARERSASVQNRVQSLAGGILASTFTVRTLVLSVRSLDRCRPSAVTEQCTASSDSLEYWIYANSTTLDAATLDAFNFLELGNRSARSLMMARNRSPSGASGSLPYLLLILNVNSPKASLLKASFPRLRVPPIAAKGVARISKCEVS